MSSVGPQRPSNIPPKLQDEGESSDDDYGPALPPSLASARANTSTPKSTPEPKAKRNVIGPSLPSFHDRRYDDTDEDDDIGPAPLPASASRSAEGEGVKAFLEAEERRKKGLEVNLLLW